MGPAADRHGDFLTSETHAASSDAVRGAVGCDGEGILRPRESDDDVDSVKQRVGRREGINYI